MLRLILTHPGGAHKDDVLAVSVLIAQHGVPVVRREPTVAELDDPTVAVVDIGGAHDASQSNFDHHHFPREHPPTCALSLVLMHLGLYEDARRFCEWLETAEWLDCRGPDKTAIHLGVPRRAIGQLNSPIDVTLMRRFARATELAPGDPLYDFMRLVGEDLLEYLQLSRERLAFVTERAATWTIAHGDQAIGVVFLPRTDSPLDEPSLALGSYIRAQGLEPTTAAIVYPDRRGSGYGISRYLDHPRLDFSRVESQPDVTFAHKTGFMCKTSATDRERLQELIVAAWIDR
ncbi:MAG: MYG1 family protein [Deltaproteobacteria bacterium]|jgi:hypothetical protein|nr:MYG1 family protein [Deltaproteobacteria bacterium]MBW2531722.1 MYG1 family protein [Deltaproteobacteria bacterium]